MMNRMLRMPAMCVLLLGLWPALARAAEPTAFELIKEGNRYVGEQAKDKIVQARSEKSIGGLVPNIWYIVYYDTTASLKATEVKFGAGRMLAVKRPLRLLEPISGADAPLDRAKLKLDSDKAIEIATREPLLEKLALKATQLKLEHSKEGQPVWKVRLWAAKLRNPDRTADIGEVTIGAEDAKVLRTDLHIDRVD
jgi:hypothetical protein